MSFTIQHQDNTNNNNNTTTNNNLNICSNKNNNNKQIEPFKVFIRIRPFLTSEITTLSNKANYPYLKYSSSPNNTPKSIFQSTLHNVTVIDPTINNSRERQYTFDGVFSPSSSTYDVFNISIKPMLENVINGYNATTLAYGVTGTGKTFTIFGDITDNATFTEKGIITYTCEYLFDKLTNKNFAIKVSYLEIYNETVIDLLNPNKTSLMIIEDNIKGIIVPELSQFEVKESNDLVQIITKGNSRRTMAPTNQNMFSSRSHALLQITLHENNEEAIYSKLLIVDLAGSERGGIEKGIRREEGANINKSLLSLGNCINILSDKNKVGAFVPYRDSKLTRLLKDSLGRNIQTVMLACVSPSPLSYEESINTLNYATRARKIQKKVVKNVKEGFQSQQGNDYVMYKEIIDSLKAEINQLKNVIKIQQEQLQNKHSNSKDQSDNSGSYNVLDISSLKDDKTNNKYEHEIIIDNKSNNNKPSLSDTIKTINEINPDIYHNYFNSSSTSTYDINIVSNLSQLEQHVGTIKTQKNLIESFLETQQIPDTTITSKYSQIKTYYDKYVSLINDKLIENIEQNMMLKCNLKEINELNETNQINLGLLNKQITALRNTKSSNDNIKSLCEEVNNINNAIKENENIKNKIYDAFARNQSIKKTLKRVLLNLLTNNEKGKGEKYINVLKEKEILQEKAKKYETKLKHAINMQNQQNAQLQNAHKEVEILKKKLEEKDKTINELKKCQTNVNFNNNPNNNNNNIRTININNCNSDSNNTKEKLLQNIKKTERTYSDYANKKKTYRTRSLGNIHVITNTNVPSNKTPTSNDNTNCNSNNNNNKPSRFMTKVTSKKSISPFNNKNNNQQNRTSSVTSNPTQTKKQNSYCLSYIKNPPQKTYTKIFLFNSQPNIDKQNKPSHNMISPPPKEMTSIKSQVTNNLSTNVVTNSNSNNKTKSNFDLIYSKIKHNNYSKYINVITPSTTAITPTNANSKPVNSLQQARLENKMKSERSFTPINLNKAETFINEYFKVKQNDSSFINVNNNNHSNRNKVELEEAISSFGKSNSQKDEDEEDQVNIMSRDCSNSKGDKKQGDESLLSSNTNSNNNNKKPSRFISDDFFNSISEEITLSQNIIN